MPCTEKRARLLLARGRARVHRVVPFVIRLVDVRVQDCEVQPLRIKLDPGSQTTGSFNIQTREGVVQGISHRHCTHVQRGDGYGYQQQQSNTDTGRGRASHDALCLPTAPARGFSRNSR